MVGRIPIDPFALAKASGLEVTYASFDDDSIAGALRKEFGRLPRILINESDFRTRQRFTCAHEIGHFVWHRDDDGEYERTDYRDDDATTGEYVEEVYANMFAACLLMPEPYIRAAYAEGLFPSEIAQRFGVSTRAVQHRLRSLQLVS